MQASKISVMICLGAMSVMPFVARGEDTPEQARLREILHAAEAGHPYQPETPAPAMTPPAAPDMAAPAAPAAPAMETPAAPAAPAEPAMTPPPAPAMETPAAPVAPVVETPAAPAAPAMETPVAPVAPVAETPAAPAVETPSVTNAMVDTNVVPAVTETAVTNPVPVPTAPDMSSMQTNMANAETSAMKQAQKPAPIPQRTLTADQQQRLAALTAQYKADQLSPEQYHEQRAKIIAEP